MAAPIIDADALQIAREDAIRNTTRIPTATNAPEIAVQDMLNALGRIEKCQTAEDAKDYVQRALETGFAYFNIGDVSRAIEMRLPAPTPGQLESLGIIKSRRTGEVLFCRVIGAFGDIVVVLRTTREPGLPYLVLLLTAPRDATAQVPAWDLTRPVTRRTWHEPQVSSSTAGVA